MIGASSEDIRLSESFYVLGEGFDKNKLKEAQTVVSDPQTATALNVFDGDNASFWEALPGYYLTVALTEGKSLSRVALRCASGTDVKSIFEIQISSGGGQFITLLRTSPQALEELVDYTFKESIGSDLRIRVVSGKIRFSELRF